MRIYFNLTEDGYLTGWNSTKSSEDDLSVWVDKDHEVLRISEIFKYEDGELIKDEDKQKRLIEEREKEESKPTEIEKLEDALLELAMITMNGGIGGE